MKITKKLISLLAAFAISVPMISFAAPNENALKAFDQKIITKVDSDKALQHIKYLSESIGPRVAGTDEEKEASNYIKSKFESYGYDVQVQNFGINNVVSELTVENFKDVLFRVNTATGSGYTDKDGIKGQVVDCGFGSDVSNFPTEVKGNVALVQRGATTFAEKAKNAEAAGAIAVIMYNNTNGNINPTLGDYKSNIPFLSVSLEDGQKIKDEMTKNSVNVSIKSNLLTDSQNIIATRKPKKVKNPEIVYVTAHYDSVPYAPGANDNASGTSMLLELAKILKSYPIDKEIRFIACGAEEIGLNGSKYYVSQLTKDELDRSCANFNMDMIATSAESCDILYADTIDGNENLVTESMTASGYRLGNEVLSIGKGSSSDHAPFGEAGIPSACFIWGDKDGNLEEYYHTPQDTIEINISTDRLQQVGELVGASLYDVVRKDTPNIERSAIRNSNPVVKKYDLNIDR